MVNRSVLPEGADLIDDWNAQALAGSDGGDGIEHWRVRMQDVRLQFARKLLQPRFSSTHQAQFVDAGRPCFRHRASVETQAVDVLDVSRRLALLGRGQMKGFPAQRPLLTQDSRGAEGVAAVQRDGVVEDVEDSHL